MGEGAPRSIIIKRVKKTSHGGHRGGAWKIAYADFVTAMMAFFLLLWLLSAVPQENLEGLSDYFAPEALSESTSGSGGIVGGTVIAEEEGAGTASSSSSGASVVSDLPPTMAGSVGEDPAERALKQIEQQQFDEAAQQIQQAFEADEELKKFKNILKIDDTPEGMRISLVDQDGLAMFQSGGSAMQPHARKLMELVAKIVIPLSQQVSISGHTDSVPFTTPDGYSNWELSSDRANAARREFMKLGLAYERVSSVVGRAATEPLLPDDPAHASNRRLSITLLRGTGDQRPPEEEPLPGLNKIKQEQLEKTLQDI